MRDDIEFNIQFCEEIEKFPCLYDYTRPDYCNKIVHDQAWHQIADKLECPVDACKERWKNVRGRYGKYKNKLKRAFGSRAIQQPKEYYLTSYLHFVDPFLSSRRIKGNRAIGESTLEDAGYSEDVDDNQSEGMNDGLDESSQVSSISNPLDVVVATMPPSHQNSSGGFRKRKLSATLDDVNNSCNYCDSKLLNRNQQKLTSSDPDRSFLDSILPDMKAMDDRQKRHFKMGILQLADQILHPSDAPVKKCQSSPKST